MTRGELIDEITRDLKEGDSVELNGKRYICKKLDLYGISLQLVEEKEERHE